LFFSFRLRTGHKLPVGMMIRVSEALYFNRMFTADERIIETSSFNMALLVSMINIFNR